MSAEKVSVDKISVDICRNDPVDVRAGGPEWLGFDFYVDEKCSEEIIKFIKASLVVLELPLASIGVVDKLSLRKEEVWDKDRILVSLNKQAEYLKHEAARNYPAYTPRRNK
jgi:hypothetical protein